MPVGAPSVCCLLSNAEDLLGVVIDFFVRRMF